MTKGPSPQTKAHVRLKQRSKIQILDINDKTSPDLSENCKGILLKQKPAVSAHAYSSPRVW